MELFLRRLETMATVDDDDKMMMLMMMMMLDGNYASLRQATKRCKRAWQALEQRPRQLRGVTHTGKGGQGRGKEVTCKSELT